MKKGTNTKRALLTSVLSLMLCVAMLVGSTFAWFTDTASTNVNSIQSGTLDVALVDANDVSLEGESLYFRNVNGDTDILWEPGATFNLDSFKIVNNGNLALKYKVIISGIIGNAELLDVIDFTVKVGEAEATKLEEWEGVLLPAGKTTIADGEEVGETSLITITGHMKEEAGNKYMDQSIEGIAITVHATQYTYENDSKDNLYDKNAWVERFATPNGDGTYSDGKNTFVKMGNTYIEVEATDVDGWYTDVDNNQYVSSADALKQAAATEENVKVIDTITYEAGNNAPIISATQNSNIDVDLAGNTLKIVSPDGKSGVWSAQGAAMTFSNGTIEANRTYGSSNTLIKAYKSTLVLDNMTLIVKEGTGYVVSGSESGSLVKINDCYIESPGETIDAIFAGSGSAVEISGDKTKIVGEISVMVNSTVTVYGGDFTEATIYNGTVKAYGGTFASSQSGKVSAATGYTKRDNGDGTFTVQAVVA